MPNAALPLRSLIAWKWSYTTCHPPPQLCYHFHKTSLCVWSDWNFGFSNLGNQSCPQSGDPISYRLQLLSRLAVVRLGYSEVGFLSFQVFFCHSLNRSLQFGSGKCNWFQTTAAWDRFQATGCSYLGATSSTGFTRLVHEIGCSYLGATSSTGCPRLVREIGFTR
jgi:hypothetical protein